MNGCKCVCCFTTIPSDNGKLVFDEEDAQNDTDNIPLMLFECLGKKFTPSSTAAICTNCLVQLRQSFAFKKKCLMFTADDQQEIAEDLDEDNDDDIALQNDFDTITEEYVEVLELKEEDLIEYTPEQANDPEYIEEDDNFENEIPDADDVDNEQQTIDNKSVDESLSLSEYISVNSYRQIFCSNATTHPYIVRKPSAIVAADSVTTSAATTIECERPSSIVSELDCSDLDVEKIATSDDLIKILEDDYHSENDSRRRQLQRLHKDYSDDVFKIPKIDVLDVCLDVEYLDEEKPINFDAYLMAIAFTVHNANSAYPQRRVCKVTKNSIRI